MATAVTNAPPALVYGEPLLELPRDLYIPPEALQVMLAAFEGPLDLLLYLIRKQNLNILDIPMAELTQQYMAYVEMVRMQSLELAADYLVMAATLTEIKSRMLLPRPEPIAAVEEDPRAELVRRLLEYEQMKRAAQQIDALPQAHRDYRPALVAAVVEQCRALPNVSADDLATAWLALMERARLTGHHKVGRKELSVRVRMTLILRALEARSATEFKALFDPEEGVAGVVVTFLAILELAKEAMIEIGQAAAFAPIYVKLRVAHAQHH